MSAPFVARTLDEIRSRGLRRSAVTLGVFDGVHRGHREIITELIQIKRKAGLDGAYVITFDPHPLVVTHSKMTPPMLTTIEERLFLLSRFDIDGILVLTFDKAMADLNYKTFLDRYLVNAFDMKKFVMGYDCFFGKDREGSPERVKQESKKMDFDVKIVDALRAQDEVVSSTKIRNALIEGDVATANKLLGHPYLISGTVVHGHGKGREIGFPTANLSIASSYKLWPPGGVYAVRVWLAGELCYGMMNVGQAPTMKSISGKEIEIHLFDIKSDLYGKELVVECHSYLREERKFPSPEALVRQLEEDRTKAQKYLAGTP